MKNSSLAVSVILTSLLLTACNTTDSSNEEVTEQKAADSITANETTVSTENESNEEKGEEASSQDASTSNNSETNVSSNEGTQQTTTIEYTFNNVPYTANTELTTSEQLDYTIQLADGFTLTSEEPGKDIIFYKEDSSYSMRVEYYDQNNSNYNDLLATLENFMVASTNDNFETVNIEQNAFEITKGTQFISVDESSDLQTIGVIFEKNGKIAVLTIFDGPENSLKNAFLQMAYTIQ